MVRPVDDSPDGIEFLVERLSWYDEVREDNFAWWDEAGFAVVDEELLRARSALELLKEAGHALPERALAVMAAADRQWRAQPKAFDYMFRYALARQESGELRGWVENEDGSTPAIPVSHWWWRPSDRW